MTDNLQPLPSVDTSAVHALAAVIHDRNPSNSEFDQDRIAVLACKLVEERDALKAELAEARNAALDEAIAFVGSLLPENGSAGPQDATDRLIDATRRTDVDSIRALKSKALSTHKETEA